MKKNKPEKICQFKITLKGISPPIWRRIQVPEDYTFWALHMAIQNSMGWHDCHLHEFKVYHPKKSYEYSIGTPCDEFDCTASWKEKIKDVISADNPDLFYLYDFGDSWEHAIKLEKILQAETGEKYPVCIGGKRACPPEDCGGIPGYEEILSGESEFMDEYEDLDPEYFNPGEISFETPESSLKMKLQFSSISR